MSVYRGSKSPYFRFDFEWRGHRYYGSTKLTDRAEAEQFEQKERERARKAHLEATRLSSISSDECETTDFVVVDNSQRPHVGRSDRFAGTARVSTEPGQHRYKLRTPEYAAKRLSCSYNTLVGYIRAGTLKFVQVGNGKRRPRRMFTDADLDEFVESQTKRYAPVFHPKVRKHQSGSNLSSEGKNFGNGTDRNARASRQRGRKPPKP